MTAGMAHGHPKSCGSGGTAALAIPRVATRHPQIFWEWSPAPPPPILGGFSTPVFFFFLIKKIKLINFF